MNQKQFAQPTDAFPTTEFNMALAHLNEDAGLSPAALAGLSNATRAQLTEFARAWGNVSVERRRRVSRQLVDLAENNIALDFNLIFRHLLNDEDGQVRANAIDGLWEDEDRALIPPLVGALRSDPEPAARIAAAEALGRFVLLCEYQRVPKEQAELIRSALVATVRSGSELLAVRARALESLAYWSGEMIRDMIANAYADEDAMMRSSAVSAMGRSADNYWSREVSRELDSRDSRMRYNAVRAAGELEIQSTVPRLIQMLEDTDYQVRSAAVTALGQIGGHTARNALVQIIEEGRESLVELARDALDELEFTRDHNLLLFETDPAEDEREHGVGAREN